MEESFTGITLSSALLMDNTVQVSGEAQGSEDGIKAFLKEINNGPRAAHVVKVDKEEIGVKDGESSFNVQ